MKTETIAMLIETAEKSRFSTPAYIGGGLYRRNLSFPDGSSLAVGYCDNPGFVGAFASVEWDGWNVNLSEPKCGSMAAIWLSTEGDAATRDAAASSLAEEIRQHALSQGAKLAKIWVAECEQYVAKYGRLAWSEKSPEFFVPAGLR